MTEPTPITGEPVVEESAPSTPVTDSVVVQNPSGWSLVQHGSWEVSIGPDGMIMLPKHLAPEEVDDFVAAVTRAASVGVETQAGNAALPATGNPAFDSTLVIQESGQPLPAGAIPLSLGGGSSTPASSSVARLDPSDPTASDRSATLPRPPAAT